MLAVVAAAAVAWFVLGVVQTHGLNAATAIAAQRAPSAAQARHANALLDTAATLNPDQQIAIVRSQLAFARGEKARARRLAAAATHAEPDNAQAWLQLVRVSAGRPSERRRAFIRLVRLVPPVKGGS